MKRILLTSLIFAQSTLVFSWDQDLVSKKVSKVSLNPMDAVWSLAPSVKVRLAPQKLVMPRGGGKLEFVEVQSLRTTSEIYFRLSWPDATRDTKLELSNRFADACAIQFPALEGRLPAPFMGEKGNPVNIWRWSAAMQEPERFPQAYADYHRPDAIEKTYQFPTKPEYLIAEGFGTLAKSDAQPLEGNGAWKDGRWIVVFKRSLKVSDGVKFKSPSVFPFAVAIWDGSNGDRDGSKVFSVWNNLLLDKSAPKPSKNIIERGRHVYLRYGCGACHGPQGKGGVANPGSQIDPVPGLELVAEGFTKDEIKTVIRNGREPIAQDPRAPSPKLWMNSWKTLMDEEELDALTDYLFSLMPKGKKEEW